ncbi:MAG: 30S ribosomal protein S6 [Parcubacteria group bacterium GW2011_GWA2_49_9]|nr:MAG: 30S ribosomal protein S6 [Parcubacteria group bacterium GW2011_GWA2_49_9]
MTEEKSSAPTGVGAPPLAQEELREERSETRIYEVGYLVVPSVSEEELPREVTALKDVLDKEKAAIISEEFPKLRALAYPMQKRVGGAYQKYQNAYFGWVKFEVSAESAKRIEQAFKQSEKVLRFILVKTVREQTVTLGRPRVTRPERKEAPKDAPASAPVSEMELDKSIEKLIAE